MILSPWQFQWQVMGIFFGLNRVRLRFPMVVYIRDFMQWTSGWWSQLMLPTKSFLQKNNQWPSYWSLQKLYNWLVVSTPLKHISQWEGLSHILWKKNVPNHQPDKVERESLNLCFQTVNPSENRWTPCYLQTFSIKKASAKSTVFHVAPWAKQSFSRPATKLHACSV